MAATTTAVPALEFQSKCNRRTPPPQYPVAAARGPGVGLWRQIANDDGRSRVSFMG